MGRERRTRAAHIIFVNVLDLGLGLKQHEAPMLKLISIKPIAQKAHSSLELFALEALQLRPLFPGPRSRADWLAVKL